MDRLDLLVWLGISAGVVLVPTGLLSLLFSEMYGHVTRADAHYSRCFLCTITGLGAALFVGSVWIATTRPCYSVFEHAIEIVYTCGGRR